MAHHIITMTDTASRAFTQNDILYTSFHSLPIQNLTSIRVKVGWFTKRAEFCYGFLTMHMVLFWCWIHSSSVMKSGSIYMAVYKCVKLLCLESGESSTFSKKSLHPQKIGVWCAMSCTRVVETIFLIQQLEVSFQNTISPKIQNWENPKNLVYVFYYA